MINNLYIKATPTTASVTWGDITGTLSDQTDLQSALDAKQATLVSGTNIKTINSTSLLGSGNVAVEPTITAGTTSQYYRGDKTFQTLDKSAVGLSNVDNTSDVNKPVSTATQTALNAKQDTLTLTTTGTSGAATLVGSTLNIPQYGGGGGPAWLESNATDLTIWNNGKGNIVSNTSFGDGALKSNTTGSLNVAIGYNAGDAITTGSSNVAVGSDALGAVTTNGSNTAVGYQALLAATSAANTAVGATSGKAVTTGGENAFFGSESGSRNTTGNANTALGTRSFVRNLTGSQNTAVGAAALYFNTVSENTAVGDSALYSNTTGASNTSVGRFALGSNTTGSQNTALGYFALSSVTTSSGNTAIGYNALDANTTGSNNTAIGRSTASGNFSGSVILGYQATATANNQFVVGSSGTNAGAVTTESLSSTKTWSVIINGVAQKILLA